VGSREPLDTGSVRHPQVAKRAETRNRGEKLKMSDEEVAFYDALEVNDSAVEALRYVAANYAKNVTIDWTVNEGLGARMRTSVRRILRAHGYPPDKREQALSVIARAELRCKDWVA
jgi:type I restriction enzyme R subunit